MTSPKPGEFYFNEGGSLILIYYSSHTYGGYNFSSKKQDFYLLSEENDRLLGRAQNNSVLLSTKIEFDVEGLIRVANKIKKTDERINF